MSKRKPILKIENQRKKEKERTETVVKKLMFFALSVKYVYARLCHFHLLLSSFINTFHFILFNTFQIQFQPFFHLNTYIHNILVSQSARQNM